MRGFVLLNVHFVTDIVTIKILKYVIRVLEAQFWTPLKTTQAAEARKKSDKFDL